MSICRVKVSTNGAVSFDNGVSEYTPEPFPIASDKMISVYWCDVDTSINDGRVYYRETTGKTSTKFYVGQF